MPPAAQDPGPSAGPDTDLLTGKFFPPSPARELAARPRLLDACSEAATRTLTLVYAPVGYGKTTLLADWYRAQADAGERLLAWLSLEPSEDDPALFWRYFIGALRAMGLGVGRHAETMLQVPGTDIEAAVRSLLNDLRASGESVVFILDDFHLVAEPACHRLLAYFLDHAPEDFHLVIATRSEPALPLPTLRATGRLAEIRASDLRLSAEEAAEFVRVGEGLSLDDEELGLLTARTEGWVAAIHLAALWLRGEPDQRAALLQFAGDNRHLVDYLGEQVLAGLDPEIERFLLETSILRRFCAPLCDAVTGRGGAAGSIADIERLNLFLVPLDGRRRWFRYHHLFGGLLQAKLADRDGEMARSLHERAYAWHRDHGTVTESVHHAILAGNYRAAGEAITSSWIALMRTGRSATIQRWLRRFPEDALADSAELGYVGVFVTALAGGTEAEVGRWLTLAEDAAEAAAAGAGDRLPDGTTSYEVNINIARAAFIYRDIGRALEVAQVLVEQEPEGGQWRVPSLAVLAFLRYAADDPTGARIAAERALADPAVSHRPHGAVHALSTLSLLDGDEGQIGKAEATAMRALEVADAAGLTRSVSSGLAHAALGRALVTLNRFDEGVPELETAAEILEGRSPIAHHVLALLLLGEGRRLGGDLIAAHRSADEAEALIDGFSDAGIFPAMLAELRRKCRLLRQRRPAGPGAELSESELAVLRLLAGPKTRREIADELCISPNTVKTHTSAIYRKLDVGSRTDAVRAARALTLL